MQGIIDYWFHSWPNIRLLVDRNRTNYRVDNEQRSSSWGIRGPPSGNVPKYFVPAIWKMVERAKFALEFIHDYHDPLPPFFITSTFPPFHYQLERKFNVDDSLTIARKFISKKKRENLFVSTNKWNRKRDVFLLRSKSLASWKTDFCIGWRNDQRGGAGRNRETKLKSSQRLWRVGNEGKVSSRKQTPREGCSLSDRSRGLIQRPSCHEENSPFSKGGILIKISAPLPLFLFSMDKQFVCDTNDYLLENWVG